LLRQHRCCLKYWIAPSCPTKSRSDKQFHARDARRPRVCQKLSPSKTEGVGNAGCPVAPAASRAENGHHAHEYSQRGTGKHPAFPHAMVYGLYALSPAIACCHRRLRIKVLSSPVGPTSLRRLDASCGRQDHTISPSASASFVLRSILKLTGDLNVHPALPCPGHARRCRVHRISSRVSDDRDTPLIWNETGWL